MAKPVIVKRNTKGSALTFTEQDANFQNLDDATITLKAGTGGTDVVSDLNGTITLVAGGGISLSGNNSTKTVTITSTESQNIFQTVVAGGTSLVADTSTDSLTFTGGNGILVTGDAGTDTATFAIGSTANADIEIQPNGTGTVNLGDKILRRSVHKDYSETVYAGGNTGSGTVTPDQENGNVQTFTATGNFTLALPTNMLTGGSCLLIITQDGTGTRIMTPNASYKFAGGVNTLSTTASAIDVLQIFYTGTNYLVSLTQDFI